jgi:hypothetical protein
MTVPIEIALIPPGALAAQYCEGRLFQMALAGELVHNNGTAGPNPDYVEFYNHAWKNLSAQWLLDNGAWEGDRLAPTDLIRVAARYGATELVAPDILYDAYGTLELTTEFLGILQDTAHPQFRYDTKPRIAAVAHGRTLREAIAFVGELNTQDVARQVKTISISRTVCYKTCNPTARFELALEIKRRYGHRYDIHLLGLSDQWPTELQHCASVPGLIRSLDTIAPFSFAHAGYSIQGIGITKVPRPDNYFQLTSEDFPNRNLLEQNIRMLDEWGRTPIERWTK